MGLRPRTPRGLRDFRLLHQALRQGGVQWRQGQGTVAINFNHHAAGTKQDDRAKLRVERAAQNQFVAVAFRHGLHGNAGEMFGSGFLCNRSLDCAIRGAHTLLRPQLQVNSIDIGLVRDGVGQKLQHNRVSDLRSMRDRLFFIHCHAGFDDGNSVVAEKLLGFEFVEQRAAAVAQLLNKFANFDARAGGGSISDPSTSAGVS